MIPDLRCLAVAALSIGIAGCATTTAEMLATPGVAYGPTSGSDFGLVRYLADGSASTLEARQEDANRKMHAACGGRYRVLAKGSRNQIQISPGAGRFGRLGATASNEEYVYIKFICTRGR